MKHIDASLMREMFLSGANNLYNHYPEIDQLNVFPVPDGDTGMNMNLTFSSGAKEIANRANDDDLYGLCSSFSRGLLMGARGNSGVITSQIFRGFAKATEGKKKLNATDLAACFTSAKETAYNAVDKPVEGTILTVIRESSEALSEYVNQSVSVKEAMAYLLEKARESLSHTPDLLPVLKEVGVVDSGGAGLVTILEGMEAAIRGKFVERLNEAEPAPMPNSSPYAGAQLSEDEEGYGYCTQFIVRLGGEGKKPFIERNFKKFLQNHGKSLVTVRDEDIVKVHVHTLYPGHMLNYAQQFGEFVTITIENMSEEHRNITDGRTATDYAVNHASPFEEKKEEVEAPREFIAEKDIGFIAVSSGEGLDEIFKELGAEALVSGGQTMNPSTDDFLNAIARAKCKNVFILPNNSNIVMAASQACEVLQDSDIIARVIPSKTIPQGIASAMAFNPEVDPDEVFQTMKSALRKVKSGSVTYAIKDTEISGVNVTKGFYLAMKDKNIVSCVKDKKAALYDLCDSLISPKSASLTLLCGQDISEEEEVSLLEELNERYGEAVEITILHGGQPVYSFLVGVE